MINISNVNILSLDLEYNQPSRRIIQVGYVIGNLQSGEVLEKVRRHVLVTEKISPEIVKLTGVTNEKCIREGWPIMEIYEEMRDLHGRHGCFRNALTWGGGDSADLMRELGMDGKNFLLGRRWIDAKTVFISHQWAHQSKTQAGLAKAMTKLGIAFEGRKHDALDDAHNTFRIYRELLHRYRRLETQ